MTPRLEMPGEPLPRCVLNNAPWGVLSTAQGEGWSVQLPVGWTTGGVSEIFRHPVRRPPRGTQASPPGTGGAVTAVRRCRGACVWFSLSHQRMESRMYAEDPGDSRTSASSKLLWGLPCCGFRAGLGDGEYSAGMAGGRRSKERT